MAETVYSAQLPTLDVLTGHMVRICYSMERMGDASIDGGSGRGTVQLSGLLVLAASEVSHIYIPFNCGIILSF